MSRVHFIAVGGSVMHYLAVDLARRGFVVTGSDDEIRDPARSRLAENGILPPAEGWFPEKITSELDFVVVGMHARADNPELTRAQELGLTLYSFPEYVYRHAEHKQRIVVTGSHGKTTVTAMIMTMLREAGRDFDYLVGARVPGFDGTIRLSEDAPLMVIEGDEYLCAPFDPRPKMTAYRPHIVVLTGIAWDHVNVFPTFEAYKDAFAQLLKNLCKAGVCVYFQDDPTVAELAAAHLKKEWHYPVPYHALPYRAGSGRAAVKIEGKRVPVRVIGKHNAANFAAALAVCRKQLAVSASACLRAVASFAGASMRIETIYRDEKNVVLRDFAHAPSKVRATLEAVRSFYREFRLVVVLELHTYSSLDKNYLPQYRNALKGVRRKIVLVDCEAAGRKRMVVPNAREVQKAFNDRNVRVVHTLEALEAELRTACLPAKKYLLAPSGLLPAPKKGTVVLLMSSGGLAGLSLSPQDVRSWFDKR
ncbi:MAG: Mur ligase family protein [Bacteroidia bacterium]|nr:Mur ligase family protein [Bacteroidia bacterium]